MDKASSITLVFIRRDISLDRRSDVVLYIDLHEGNITLFEKNKSSEEGFV